MIPDVRYVVHNMGQAISAQDGTRPVLGTSCQVVVDYKKYIVEQVYRSLYLIFLITFSLQHVMC